MIAVLIAVFTVVVAVVTTLLKCVCVKTAMRNKHPSTPKRPRKKAVCPGAPVHKRTVRRTQTNPRSLVF